jgi:hypothetical protein
VPILGTKTWTSKEEAATFVCIEREKQQKRLSERDLLLEIALFCPNRELHRGALQADSVDYSTFWFRVWANPIIRGDGEAYVTGLKQQEGRDLLISGHGLLGETLLKHHLLDVLDLSISPLILEQGKQFFRQGANTTLRLVTAKSFSKGMVKLTYEPQH